MTKLQPHHQWILDNWGTATKEQIEHVLDRPFSAAIQVAYYLRQRGHDVPLRPNPLARPNELELVTWLQKHWPKSPRSAIIKYTGVDTWQQVRNVVLYLRQKGFIIPKRAKNNAG